MTARASPPAGYPVRQPLTRLSLIAVLLAHRAWWSRLSVGSRDDPVQTVA